MEKKKYYAITTSMTFEKTVLVPVDSVEDIDEAIELVDKKVEDFTIELLNGEVECETKPSCYADENGVYELSDEDVAYYQILEGDKALQSITKAVDRALDKYGSDNVDVVYNMETGMLDVMYCSGNNSFRIEETNVLLDDINVGELLAELEERYVGYVGR